MSTLTDKPIVVLENANAEDTARAIISSGNQSDPFYTFDMDEAFKRMTYFKKMMPRVQPFYAMKANPIDMMLRLAVSAGFGFDCASTKEIEKVLQLGVNPTSIIYAMPTKNKYEMIYANRAGVTHTTFDSSYELKKLKNYWPDAKLLIRIKVDGDSIYRLGAKFGCDCHTEAIQLLEEAADYGLNVIGVAFHVGSGCKSVDSHAVGLKLARSLFDHEARAGRRMCIVDIGGGFLSDSLDRIDQPAAIINKSLSELFPDPEEAQVIAEPGRYICDSAFTLYCSIANVRSFYENNTKINMIYLNDGVYGTLRFFESWHVVKKFQTNKSISKIEDFEETILWGPSCDSYDRVFPSRTLLLPTCSPQDWLVFKHQGAYSFMFYTKFSFLESPKMRTVISAELWSKLKNSPILRDCSFVTSPSLSTPLPQRSSTPPNFELNRLLKTPTLSSDNIDEIIKPLVLNNGNHNDHPYL